MPNWSHRSSNVGDAHLMTTYADDYMARGYGFAIEEVFEIASGTSLFLNIDYTTYTDFSFSCCDNIRIPRKGWVFILPPNMITSAGPVVVDVYRGGDYSGGSAVLYSSRNTLSDVEPQITITQGATGTDKGTLSLQYLVGGDATFFARGGAAMAPNIPFLRDNTDTTLVEIRNESGYAIFFGYNQVFYEI